MCLCRLMKLLNLTKIIQTSFAEYHSKRNFVERVHSEENRVLSSHGPFNSKSIHQHAKPGTDEHMENMEAVAEDVRKCLVQASFGGRHSMCYRGVKPDDYVFSDEEQLQSFLSLSEDGKQHYSPAAYSVNKGEVLHSLHMFWDVNEDFSSEYIKDHQTIQNELLDGIRTSWLDKYTTCLYTTEMERECRRFELQPLPDYLRWFKTGELHYLPLEERALVLGPWDEIPGAFLPTKVLDLCLSVIQEPPESIIKQMALLSWVTQTEVTNYIKKVQTQIEAQLEAELEKMRWRTHPLYKSKTKAQLEAECKQLKIPVTSNLAKHQLTTLIVKKKGELPPPELSHKELYSGALPDIPTSIAAINRLTIPVLRAILKHHKIPNIGIKENLVMRVFLLRHNRTVGITSREEKQIKDLINLVYKVILEQRKLHVTSCNIPCL